MWHGIYAPVGTAGAGVTYFYDTSNFFLFILTKDGTDRAVLRFLQCRSGAVEVLSEELVSADGIPERTELIHLRIETDEDGKSAVFSWSRDGQEYNKTAEADTQILTDEHCVGFTGAHFGIYCHDMDTQSNYADFKYFRVLESGE